jgi:transketolase
LNYLSASELAYQARKNILKMTAEAKASHVGSALSVVDLLAVLYAKVINFDSKHPDLPKRDKVILSKGHAASALYSVLSLVGFFPIEWLNNYCKNDSTLGGHVTSENVPGVELSTGSLGHGLPYGIGIAYSDKKSDLDSRTFVIMSDGECDEGTTWESALFANHHGLDNLCVIVDRNRIQSLASTEDTLKLEPFDEKWRAFGWDVRVIDGHNYDEISNALIRSEKPLCVIAETTKGKGVDFMENSVLWHYRPPNENELLEALNRIEQNIL